MSIVKSHRLLGAGAAVVIVMALVVLDARHTTTSGGPAVVSGKVPVVACPTTRGVPESGPARFGRELKPAHIVDVPLFSYYTDDSRQVTPLLGPRGWRCHVVVAADGGVSITLAPPLIAVREEPSTALVRIRAEAEPACQGCVYALVCAYLPTADQLVKDFGKCAERRRPRTHLTWLVGPPGQQGTAVARIDRPKIITCGSIAAGCWHSSVILLRSNPKARRSASREWCGLTGSAYRLCSVLFADFRARQWGLA